MGVSRNEYKNTDGLAWFCSPIRARLEKANDRKLTWLARGCCRAAMVFQEVRVASFVGYVKTPGKRINKLSPLNIASGELSKMMSLSINLHPRFYYLALDLYLFRRDVVVGREVLGSVESVEAADECGCICCPLCQWRPRASDRWYCGDCRHPEGFLEGCGMVWNTFETRGRCPGCCHRWRWTVCLSCHQWSLHEDWYAKEKR